VSLAKKFDRLVVEDGDVSSEARRELALAVAAESQAARLRREAAASPEQGDTSAAAIAYDEAARRYADSGLDYHRQRECELAREVERAITRCRKIAGNIRHPSKRRPATTTPRPCCLSCGKPLRRFRLDGRKMSDGKPREWGDYGDNRFCGLTCGWKWACAHTRSP
jgi:hypothetical protein